MHLAAAVAANHRFDESQEVSAGVPGRAVSDDPPGGDLQRRVQAREAMPAIVVGLARRQPGPQGQQGLGPTQRLDLRLLVQAQDHRARRRIQVEPDHVVDLVLGLRIGRELERRDPMRLERVGAPDLVARIDKVVRAPYIYSWLAYLHFYTRNTEKSLAVLKEAVDKFKDDLILTFQYAHTAYFGEVEFDEVLAYADRSLKTVDNAAEKVRKAEEQNVLLKSLDPNKAEAVKEAEALKARYEDGRVWVTNFIAYISAQAGVRERAALALAESNYQKLHDEKIVKRRTGVSADATARVTLIDTYGYVLLAFGARQTPRDLAAIRQAKVLFEEAKSEAAGLDARTKRLTTAVLDSHLRQAGKLLAP